jgi:hypothetical protein
MFTIGEYLQKDTFKRLYGKTLKNISGLSKRSKIVRFTINEKEEYVLKHIQECCEEVQIEELIGDPEDILGFPLILAEEVSQKVEGDESQTYTFYKLATIKGYVTIRFLGSSTGEYSEKVDFFSVSNDMFRRNILNDYEKKILAESLLRELINLQKHELETNYPHFTMYLNPPCDFSVIVCGRTADLPTIGIEDPCKDYED